MRVTAAFPSPFFFLFSQVVVTQWEAGLAAAARGEATAAAGWETATEHLLQVYSTREAIEEKTARAKVEAVLARLWLTAEEQRLFSLRGARGLSASEQAAKTRALAKVRSRWASLVDKWLFPESARVPIDGNFWRRNAVGYGVTSVERVPAAAAAQTSGKKRGGGAGAAGDATLAAIAEYGVQTPPDLWAIHDRGPTTDGCGGWRQFRLVFAAPSSYGKSFLARELLKVRVARMTADLRGVGPFTPDNIVVYSGSGGAGWSDMRHVCEYDAEEVAAKYAEWEAEALAFKAAGRVPPARLFILDDLASLKGVEQDPTITRMFVMGRHIGVSVVLIGQSPRGLVSPIRKTNTTLYFFGTYSKEPQYNKPFAVAARVSEGVYADWCRGHLGKKNGYVFGVQPEEGVGDLELPWCLAAASKPAADDDDAEDMAAPPPPPTRRHAAEHLEEYDDGDTMDYAAAASQQKPLGVSAAFSSLALGGKPAVVPPPAAAAMPVATTGRVKGVRLYDAPRVAAGTLPPITAGVKTVGFFEAGVAITVGECLWDTSAASVLPAGLALCDDDADLLDL